MVALVKNTFRLSVVQWLVIAVLCVAVTSVFYPVANPNLFAAAAQEDEKPQIRLIVPKTANLKIELENADKKEVAKELRLKVTNKGKKPIYMLKFFLSPEGVLAPNGVQYGMQMLYGSGSIENLKALAATGDDSIEPGETVLLQLKAKQAETFRKYQASSNFAYPKNFTIEFSWLSYGDGTALLGGGTPVGEEKKPQPSDSPTAKPQVSLWEEKKTVLRAVAPQT